MSSKSSFNISLTETRHLKPSQIETNLFLFNSTSPVLKGLEDMSFFASHSLLNFPFFSKNPQCFEAQAICNEGDLGLIPGLGRFLENGEATHYSILA